MSPIRLEDYNCCCKHELRQDTSSLWKKNMLLEPDKELTIN